MFPVFQTLEEYVAFYLTVNQFLGGFALFKFCSTFSPDFNVDDKKIEEFSNSPKDFDALDYVNIANSLVSQGGCREDCKDYTFATFYCYRSLIRLNQRKDLKKDVRILVGEILPVAHAWLEVVHDDSIIPYECTLETPPLKVQDVKSYSEQSLTEKMMYLIERGAGSRVFLKGLWGRDFGFPTFYSFFYPGGFVMMVYGGLRNRS